MDKKMHFAIKQDSSGYDGSTHGIFMRYGRCGAKSPNRSQFTGNPRLEPLKATDDWAKVTCKRCQDSYVRTSGVMPPFEKGEQEQQPCLNELVLEVKVRTAWGEERIYPVNKAAKIIAAIAGTTTLTDSTLALAKKLGYKVVQPAKEY